MRGCQVRSGCLQSMPSHNIESCARVNDTVPLVACGHTNLPRSRRFCRRQTPSPSCQRTFMRSPRRPRKRKTWPDKGLLSSVLCTRPHRLVCPRRISVMPATSQICVLAGIIRASSPPLHERYRQRPGAVSLEGLSRQQQDQNHGPGGRRVHPEVSAPCLTGRLSAHSLLWLLGKP